MVPYFSQNKGQTYWLSLKGLSWTDHSFLVSFHVIFFFTFKEISIINFSKFPEFVMLFLPFTARHCFFSLSRMLFSFLPSPDSGQHDFQLSSDSSTAGAHILDSAPIWIRTLSISYSVILRQLNLSNSPHI